MSGIMIQPVQGYFTSDGTAKFLEIPGGFDWIETLNLTVAAAAASDDGVKFLFDPHSMAQGTGYQEQSTAAGATNALRPSILAAGTGFYNIDTSNQEPGASVALTAISADPVPEVTAATVVGLNNGDTVRIYNTVGAQQLGGIDFTIGNVTGGVGGTFELSYMAQIAAATTGTFRKIPFNPIYYPRNRVITKISQATQAVVTLSVTHGYNVGQKVRFVIPEVTATAYGMTALNDVVATIVAVSTVNNTITIDVDTSAMTAFAFPLTADGDFTPAQIVPAGMNTATALQYGVNIHSDASRNTAQLGVLLMAGANSPAGVDGDVIFWRAGQSFTINNQ